MMEKLNEAYEELKRVDHLIYVSLKYTRTVDVIINILARSVDAYALMVDSLIMYAKEQGKILQEPESAIERAELIKGMFNDDEAVVDNMQLYLLERKLLRARSVERENEYRRHVTMKTIIEGREEIINIDIITNYYLYQREFLNHVRNIIEGKSTVGPKQQEFAQPQTPAWMTEEHEEEERAPAPQMRDVVRPKPQQPTRKREPRPRKYKIQIPKGKNPILRAPYQPPPRKPVEKKPVKKAPKKAAPKRAGKKR